jgi:long-chain acyl-CoA synthetase
MTDTQTNIRLAQTFRNKEAFPPAFPTIPAMIAAHVERAPDATYLVGYDAKGTRTVFTYRQFADRVSRAAAGLVKLGVKPGDRVATFASNHVETVIAYFAAWTLGACVVPVNMTEDDDRKQFILENSNAKVLLALGEYMEQAVEFAENIPHIAHVVQLTGAEAENSPTKWNTGRILNSQFSTLNSSAEALIVYTSGTTGAPKGVVLTQSNLLCDARALAEWNSLEADQRMMCVLPIHHVNGIVVTLVTPLYAGASTVLNPRFSPSNFWERIAAERVRIVSVVPTLLAFLLENPGLREGHEVECLSHIICGAGPLTVDLARQFEDTFNARVLHGYGLSETTCYSSMLPLALTPDDHKHWMRDFGFPSIGVAIPGCEMAIHDPEGNALPTSTRGEIVICGPIVMEGYFNRPESNAEAFAHGWFRSGDEGFFEKDEQGREFFFITGRIKELIIRGGVNLSPFEIDEVLNGIEGVKCGLAVGFENRWYGEEVGAYVVLEEGATLDAETIIAAAREHLPFHKSPKAVVFGTEIPVTSTGKYQRNKLKASFAEWKDVQFKS